MDAWTVLAIVGLTAITVITRSLFFISARPLELPPWLRRGLDHAGVAALAAVVVPEVLLGAGAGSGTGAHHWIDARLAAAAVGLAWYYWRRSVLGTIVVGMLVYLPLKLCCS